MILYQDLFLETEFVKLLDLSFGSLRGEEVELIFGICVCGSIYKNKIRKIKRNKIISK